MHCSFLPFTYVCICLCRYLRICLVTCCTVKASVCVQYYSTHKPAELFASDPGTLPTIRPLNLITSHIPTTSRYCSRVCISNCVHAVFIVASSIAVLMGHNKWVTLLSCALVFKGFSSFSVQWRLNTKLWPRSRSITPFSVSHHLP